MIYDMDKTYEITLADGTAIPNLSANGNCFISKEDLDESIFKDNTHKVVISDGEVETEMENMEFVRAFGADGFWFALTEIPEQELKRRKLESDLEYVAMMADVEL